MRQSGTIVVNADNGAITGITMNGDPQPVLYGIADLGTVITSHQDISGKVDGPDSATNNAVAIFDGTGGKAVKDSGFTIGKSVPSDAVFTDTTYSIATTASDGLMSSTDKTKLDGVATGATANVGTITGITMNGSSKGTSGVVDLGTVITAHQDISGKVSGPSSSTANAVAIFNGTGGKTIKDSGFTIGKSVPSDAVFTDTTYSVATTSSNGLMSSSDKTKLNGIATGATANVGTITGITMNGSSKGTSGVVDLGTVITAHQDISGKVDGPSSATANAVAIFDGTGGKKVKNSGYTIGKSVPSDAVFTDTTYSVATTSSNGLMSSSDKTKLNGIATGATANVGTITGITMNGSSKGTSGVVDLGTVITAHQDISGKVNKSGDTMTGNLTVQKASGDISVYSKNTTSGLAVDLRVGSSGSNHGVYSNGYYDGTNFTSDPKWIIYRNSSGNVIVNGTATGNLTAHQTIKQDGITGATVNRFGTCSTAAATAAKTVSITSGTFSLEAGSLVAVKFSNANTAASPTLNVNSKGAKNIFVNGAQITTSAAQYGLLKGTVLFIYDGTQFHLIGNYYNSNTTYSAGTGLTLSSTTFSVSKANVSEMINLLDTGSSASGQEDYLIAQYANGGTTNTGFYRKALKNVITKANVTAALGGTAVLTSTDQTVGGTKTFSSQIFNTGGAFRRKNTSLDATASDNGLTSNVDVSFATYCDNNNKNIAFAGVVAKTNGQTGAYITAQNYKSDGTTINNTIGAYITKDGTMSYGVSNQSAFRSAIGVINRTAASGGTDLSLVTTGDKYTWNNIVSATTANVKSALGTGTNAYKFLRNDGTFQRPFLIESVSAHGSANILGKYGIVFGDGCIWLINGTTFTKLSGSSTSISFSKYPASGTQTGYTVSNSSSSIIQLYHFITN